MAWNEPRYRDPREDETYGPKKSECVRLRFIIAWSIALFCIGMFVGKAIWGA